MDVVFIVWMMIQLIEVEAIATLRMMRQEKLAISNYSYSVWIIRYGLMGDESGFMSK